jgi:hypothetical protein
MRTVTGIALVFLVAAPSCATEIDDVASNPDTHAEVSAKTAALSGSCEGREDELKEFAMWASSAAIEAFTDYEQDPNNELATRYFGQNYDQSLVHARLVRIGQLGRSERLHFVCLDANDDTCSDDNSKVFYTWDTEWRDTDGWNIYVCADRFWADQYVNGVDSDFGASQIGIMVHEISHLTGAISDAFRGNEQAVIDAAADPTGSYLMPGVADAHRFYVMKTIQ